MIELELMLRRGLYLVVFMCVGLPGAMLLFLISEKRIRLSESLRAVTVLSSEETYAFAIVSTVAAWTGLAVSFWGGQVTRRVPLKTAG